MVSVDLAGCAPWWFRGSQGAGFLEALLDRLLLVVIGSSGAFAERYAPQEDMDRFAGKEARDCPPVTNNPCGSRRLLTSPLSSSPRSLKTRILDEMPKSVDDLPL